MSLRPYRDIIKKKTKEIKVGDVKIGGSIQYLYSRWLIR